MKNFTNLHWFILAGLFGGLAEVIWIGLYVSVSDITLAAIGGEIAGTVFPGGSELLLAPFTGLMIHMLLSVLLALGFGYLIWPWIERVFHHRQAAMITSVVALVLVWKVNFFFLLPVWNPEFVGMLPLGVSLVSKSLFGMAMGAVLTYRRHELELV